MNGTAFSTLFEALSTAHVADACLRTGAPVRCAPCEIRAMDPSYRAVGPVRPARHAGSVDVFLEAIGQAAAGDVLVADNSGRRDEACVGDLIALEARDAGLAGVIVWGLHRDTADLLRIGLPVFSLGSCPTGPLRLDPRPPHALGTATVGLWTVGPDDVALADADGVVFVARARAEEIAAAARAIQRTERRQADRMRQGTSLRAQLRFAEFLSARDGKPTLTFREHLRGIGGAIEE